jgi:hypothetical protein
MTAFAFILGVVALMKASGAGAGAQNVMGTGVFFGMLVATALGVFIIPGNYTFIEGLRFPWRRKTKEAPVVLPTPAGDGSPAAVPGSADYSPPPVLPVQAGIGGHGHSATAASPAKAGGEHR